MTAVIHVVHKSCVIERKLERKSRNWIKKSKYFRWRHFKKKSNLSSLLISTQPFLFIIFYIFPPLSSFEFSFSSELQQCRTLRGICVWAQRAVIPLSSLIWFWWYTNGYLVPFLPGSQAVNISQTFYIFFFYILLSPLPSKTSFFFLSFFLFSFSLI
jgi:hypothetical protein